ncbi:hypothetical protein J4H39_04845 [Vibrio alginolyticus]|uniref:Uncharacterized protein n=2 Tax=Vibrio alginolyticus TaxID=663 RepID=A0A7Y0MWE9_VIBAL|nr:MULTISPECIES: hypothetical protein [Vibrio]EHH2454330.1 hypothetical protein [Vibrio parahaemolyticus]AGV19984.1 hypothetical protein N646_4175 [Vibrio alginolyticus NBRC 15630 = ATCC 17749]AVF68560.1 hypothetical protein AL545_05335 [Vibrio alginolyticus]EAS76093.1 hypothetical protein V12G01_09020 [Vibrio alginolyticus 12G01]EGR2550999.1 hypothetical protein [Vibrio alginolyticus]
MGIIWRLKLEFGTPALSEIGSGKFGGIELSSEEIYKVRTETTCSSVMENGGMLSEASSPKILGWEVVRLVLMVNASIGYLYQENGT